MKNNIFEDCAVLIHKAFDLPGEKRELSREGLIDMLEPEIRSLLDRNFEKLLQICYRIDLGEEKLKHILQKSNPEYLCKDLTEALVDRQILKVKLKSQYKNQD
ncbi:MAG: hypothetical protein WD426_13010 [Anditalea sp.]